MSDELGDCGRGVSLAPGCRDGKVPRLQEMARAHVASGADMVTVAVRRVNLSDRTKESLLDYIDREKIFIFRIPRDATRRMKRCVPRDLGARRTLKWVKLEVIGDQQTLFDTEELVRRLRHL